VGALVADQIRQITAVERARPSGGCAWSGARRPRGHPWRRVYHRFCGHSYPHRPVHITSASGPASATAAGQGRATPVSLQPHVTDSDLQAVVTHEVYDIDADDLRDLLERLEVRIGAR